jgi:hypothetical protein
VRGTHSKHAGEKSGFEELYTLCPDKAIRQRFLDVLLACLPATSSPTTPTPTTQSPLVLVATMRADFLSNALAYRPFADVLQAGDIKLPAMTPEELMEVIEKPAQKLGVGFEEGLVNRILQDVSNQPGNLPLLEFALTELWQHRQGALLTHRAYEDIGEVRGALARHAGTQYSRFTPQEQEDIRRIFIQLVYPGQGTEDTRRLATKTELGEANWALVKHLADARLVVTSLDPNQQQETVEVVHEALIRHWGQLRHWMNTNREFRLWQDRLRGSIQQWESSHQDWAASVDPKWPSGCGLGRQLQPRWSADCFGWSGKSSHIVEPQWARNSDPEGPRRQWGCVGSQLQPE